MKNLFFLTIASVILLSSCALHLGDMQDSASLQSDNFELISLAEGTSRNTYLFGFGGLKNRTLMLDAKKDMYKRNPLKRGQTFANLTVDREVTFIFFYTRVTYTVSADIVQFDTDSQYPRDQKVYTQLNSRVNELDDPIVNHPFNIKDSVVLKISKWKLAHGTVVAYKGDNMVVAMYDHALPSGRNTMSVNPERLFISTRPSTTSTNKIYVGDSVSFTFGGINRVGEVLGVNNKEYLIQSEDYYYQVSPASVRLK